MACLMAPASASSTDLPWGNVTDLAFDAKAVVLSAKQVQVSGRKNIFHPPILYKAPPLCIIIIIIIANTGAAVGC